MESWEMRRQKFLQRKTYPVQKLRRKRRWPSGGKNQRQCPPEMHDSMLPGAVTNDCQQNTMGLKPREGLLFIYLSRDVK